MAAVNWDNLNTGDPSLNHSEFFFEQRHIEHERLDDIIQIKQQQQQQTTTATTTLTTTDNNTNGGVVEELMMKPPPAPLPALAVKEILNGGGNDPKPIAKVKGRKTDESKNKENHIVTEETVEIQATATVKAMENLVKKQGGMERVLTTSNPRIARLQNYASQYNKHKQDLIEKKKKEEEQNKPRPFKARPLPKYLKAAGKKNESTGDQADGGKDKETSTTGRRTTSAPTSRASSQPPRTVPLAPKPILRARSASAAPNVPSMITRSKAAKQAATAPGTKSAPPVARVKPSVKPTTRPATKPVPLKATHSVDGGAAKKVSSAPAGKVDAKQKKFVAKVPTYLKKEPFKVKLAEKKSPVEVKPFNLGMNGRMETRQKTENDRRKALEEKNRQMFEEKRKREEQELKEMRKKTQFRARTNPFSGKVTKTSKVQQNGVKEEAPKNGLKAEE